MTHHLINSNIKIKYKIQTSKFKLFKKSVDGFNMEKTTDRRRLSNNGKIKIYKGIYFSKK